MLLDELLVGRIVEKVTPQKLAVIHPPMESPTDPIKMSTTCL
jgi:hypothetical protein